MSKNKEKLNPAGDFKAAVARITDDYPVLAGSTVFLSTQEHVGSADLHMHGNAKTIAHHEGCDFIVGFIRENLLKSFNEKSSYFAHHKSGYQAVIFNAQTLIMAELASDEDRQAFSFRHEAGHFLTRRGSAIDDPQPVSENSADGFGLIDTIRAGENADGHLSALPAFRAREFIEHIKSTHMTLPLAVAILQDEACGKIGTPDTQDVRGLVDFYVRKYTPKARDLHEAQNAFFNVRGFAENAGQQEQMARVLMETRDKFAFVIGTTALLPMLSSTAPHALLPQGQRAEITFKLQKRADDMDVANKIVLPKEKRLGL